MTMMKCLVAWTLLLTIGLHLLSTMKLRDA